MIQELKKELDIIILIDIQGFWWDIKKPKKLYRYHTHGRKFDKLTAKNRINTVYKWSLQPAKINNYFNDIYSYTTGYMPCISAWLGNFNKTDYSCLFVKELDNINITDINIANRFILVDTKHRKSKKIISKLELYKED